MKIRKITAVDLCAITGYSRDQLRGLIDKLPVFSDQETAPRVAREFTRSDVTLLAVVRVLEVQYSVRRESIASITKLLHKALTGPKAVNRNARLLISFDPQTVSYLTEDVPRQDGILMSLGPVFQRIDAYLGQNLPIAEKAQSELRLGPTLISGSRRKAPQ